MTPYQYYRRISQKNCKPLMREKLVLTSRQGGLWFLKTGFSVLKVSDINTLKQEMRKWLD